MRSPYVSPELFVEIRRSTVFVQGVPPRAKGGPSRVPPKGVAKGG
jgi:hypothetical protein